MSVNVYLSPIRAYFKPLPEFTIYPQSLFKKITGLFDSDKVSVNTARAVIIPLSLSALISSYLLSPNVMIPLQILKVVNFASSSYTSGATKVINTIFSTTILGLICKYTQDGTLSRLSNDLYSLSSEANRIINQLNNKNDNEVTYHEPLQLPDNPHQNSYFRSTVLFINSIFRRIFQFFFRLFWPL